LSVIVDPRAVMAARNNLDWHEMMWGLRGLQYVCDLQGFRAIDPPPPYHGWAVAAHGAPVAQIVADYANQAGFGIKDASGAANLTEQGLVPLFKASWIHHPPSDGMPDGWEAIKTPQALLQWEAAWKVTSPTSQRQFPDPILQRSDVAIFGRRAGQGYDAGVIANLSDDCVGLSNGFGADIWPAATQLCGCFGAGRPVVGYERGADLADALAAGWQVAGDLTVWVRPCFA
jgi:hypothetical protein